MNFLVGILAALGLGVGAIITPVPSTPTPVAEAAACKTVTDGDIRGYNLGGMYSFGMSWTHAGFGSQQYLVERSDDAGATWYTVQSSTAKSYSVSGMGVLGDDVRFRLSTANCDTAGVVFTVDPPSAGYYNQDIY